MRKRLAEDRGNVRSWGDPPQQFRLNRPFLLHSVMQRNRDHGVSRRIAVAGTALAGEGESGWLRAMQTTAWLD